MPLNIEVRRGGFVESVHAVSAVLVEAGSPRWSVGPDLGTFWRSGCKPFQLLNSLACLDPAVVAALPDEDLAIGASSHSGQPVHTERVAALLAQFELSASHLRCGAHWPMHEPSARLLMAAGNPCTTLHSNCSGKHTFMLAACRARGWSEDYRSLAHPLQQGNRAVLGDWMGHAPDTAIDGCSIPTFFAPLSAMARAFARLAVEMADRGPAGRIGWAMQRHPDLTSGTDRLDLAVVRGGAEPITAKIGAEGLFCIALPHRRQGLVLKCHSGNADALAVAIPAILNEVAPGLLAASEWPWAVVSNVAGLTVGDRIVRWT